MNRGDVFDADLFEAAVDIGLGGRRPSYLSHPLRFFTALSSAVVS